MSPPPIPSFASTIATVFRMQWKRTVRGKRVILAGVSVLSVLIAVVASVYSQDMTAPLPEDPSRTALAGAVQNGYQIGFFYLLIFLIPFLFNAGSIAEEVESRTFAFIASRPANRTAVTLGKYLVGSSVSLGFIALGMLLLHVVAYAQEPASMVSELPYTLRTIGAASLLVLFYSSVCTFWGSVAPEASGIVSAIHLGLVEFGLTWFPGVFRLGSLNYHARELAGLPKNHLFELFSLLSLPDVPIWASLLALSIGTMLGIFFTGVIVTNSEYRFSSS